MFPKIALTCIDKFQNMSIQHSRRGFILNLGGSVAAAAIAGIGRAETSQQEGKSDFQAKTVAPSDKIRIAVIGLGLMGFGDAETALKVPGVELAGACDLYEGHFDRARELWGKDFYLTKDYAELLAKKDIDAVIIATPDHWHAKISISAMRAGKHVYCEKPMVQKIEQGSEVLKAARESGKVFVVGSQAVSSVITEEARLIFSKGELGDLDLIEAVHDSYSVTGAWNYSIPTDASPARVDWERFLGDAPKRDFEPLRFFRWRNYRDYGTGVGGDIFIHKISPVHHIINSTGPQSIYANGQLSFWKDGRDVPDILTAILQYPQAKSHNAFPFQLRVNLADASGGRSYTRIVGTEGALEITGNNMVFKKRKLSKAPGYGGWDGYNVFSSKQQKDFVKWYNEKYTSADQVKIQPFEKKSAAPAGYDDRLDHFTYFFNAIRGGKPVVENAEFGFRAAAPVLACNLSNEEKRIVYWDPEGMKLMLNVER